MRTCGPVFFCPVRHWISDNLRDGKFFFKPPQMRGGICMVGARTPDCPAGGALRWRGSAGERGPANIRRDAPGMGHRLRPGHAGKGRPERPSGQGVNASRPSPGGWAWPGRRIRTSPPRPMRGHDGSLRAGPSPEWAGIGDRDDADGFRSPPPRSAALPWMQSPVGHGTSRGMACRTSRGRRIRLSDCAYSRLRRKGCSGTTEETARSRTSRDPASSPAAQGRGRTVR
jgi:hypothetical protein